jgi:plasmid stabilization system protein ParE
VTARAEYTDEEWQLLQMAPYAVGFAVAFADGSGVVESFKEIGALITERARAVARYPGNELLASLWAGQLSTAGAGEPVVPETGANDIAEVLLARALDSCGQVVALLEERSNPDEADGYQRLLMDVAKATASAHRHGGWLARGSLVDEQERRVLNRLAKLLGVEAGLAPEGIPSGSIQPE